MRIACTGSKGRVGQYLTEKGVLPLVCDVTDSVQVDKAIDEVKPDIILHLAAKSNINWCDKLSNVAILNDVNLLGTSAVFEMGEKHGIPVVFFSSSHVFDGKKRWGKYKELDKRNPINQYGLSKLTGEALTGAYDLTKVIRTSYLFDRNRLENDYKVIMGTKTDKSYPTFMYRSFLYIPHFVELLLDYCNRYDKMPKILHLSGVDSVSWHKFIFTMARLYGLNGLNVQRRNKDLKGEEANRGYNLGLDVSRSLQLGFNQYSYYDGLKEMTLA